MASREMLKVWKETAFGVFANPTTPTKNTDFVAIRLDQSNSYTLRPKPVQQSIRTADSTNRRIQMVSTQTGLAGNLSTLFYPEQAQFLLDWALTLTSLDLGSCTVDHAIQLEDGSVTYTRHLGCKVEQLQVTTSADSPLTRLNFQLVSQKPATITGTDFPDIPQTDYPTGVPYVFTHLGTPGHLKLSNTNRSEFASFDLTVKNMLDHPFFESPYVTRMRWCGRDVDWSDKLVYKSAADRSAYEANTAEVCDARFDNGTTSCLFTMGAHNFMSAVEDDLALDKIYYQTLSWENHLDPTSGNDITFTVT